MMINLFIQLSLIVLFSTTIINLIFDIYYPIAHTLITIIKYVTLLYILFYSYSRNIIKFNTIPAKLLFYFFIIYSVIVLKDLTIDRTLPLKSLLGVPENIFTYIKETLYIICIMMTISIYNYKKLNSKYLYLSYIILTLIPCLWYIHYVGIDNLQVTQIDSEVVFINPLTISNYTSACLLLAITYKNQWSQNKFVNFIIFIIILASSIYIFSSCAKRGPILWFFISLLLLVYAKSKNKTTMFIKFFIIILIFYSIGNIILESIKEYSPYLVSRIQDAIYEGDTSGRFSSDNNDTGYGLALKQISESPWIGSYFRMTTSVSMWKGMYPHNIILEALMTFGIIGLIPFISFIIKGIKRGIYLMSKNNNVNTDMMISFFFVTFINSFFSLMTTGTILLNTPFWISLLFLLNIRIPQKNE